MSGEKGWPPVEGDFMTSHGIAELSTSGRPVVVRVVGRLVVGLAVVVRARVVGFLVVVAGRVVFDGVAEDGLVGRVVLVGARVVGRLVALGRAVVDGGRAVDVLVVGSAVVDETRGVGFLVVFLVVFLVDGVRVVGFLVDVDWGRFVTGFWLTADLALDGLRVNTFGETVVGFNHVWWSVDLRLR